MSCYSWAGDRPTVRGVAHRNPDDLVRDVGRRIAELREERDLTQQALADAMDISPQYLRRVEAGQVNMTIRSLAKFGAGLSVPVSDLFVAPSRRRARPPGRPKRSR